MSSGDTENEVITVQVGGFSNWVGAHLWGLDLKDPSKSLYTSSQAKTVPRVVAFDLRGRRGSLFSGEGADHSKSTSVPVRWSGPIETHESEFHENPFKRYIAVEQEDGEAEEEDDTEDFLDDSIFYSGHRADTGESFAQNARILLQAHHREAEGNVAEMNTCLGDEPLGIEEDSELIAEARSQVSVWSDFLECRLNPSSYVEVPVWDVRTGTFSSFSSGDFSSSDCVLSFDFKEEAFDRLRLALEDCDVVQGWHFILDAQGGFAGASASLGW